MAATVRVERVFNNNVVLGHEADGGTVMLVGKGIGWGHRAGDEVSDEGTQRFVPDVGVRHERLAGVLGQASDEEVEAAAAIVTLAHRELGLPASEALLLPVLDHLCGAAARARRDVRIDFPLVWEVGQLYPAEAAFGRRAAVLAEQRLGVRLQQEEWVAFALHCINQQWARSDVGATFAMTETLNAVFDHLEVRWGMALDRTSTGCSRFVTHLRYLFARLASGAEGQGPGAELLPTLSARNPQETRVAHELAELIGGSFGRRPSDDEVAYLALHVARLRADQQRPA